MTLAVHAASDGEFEPSDDFVGFSTGMLGRYPYPGALEELFLHRGKLLFTEAGVGGEFKSVWDYGSKDPQKPLQVWITHSGAYGNMPIEVNYKSPIGNERTFSHARFHWKKFNGMLLPDRIEWASPYSVGGRILVSQSAFKVRWLVGKQVPNAVFDFESDPRDPLLNLFGIDYEKDGRTAKKPWTVPEDLYDVK